MIIGQERGHEIYWSGEDWRYRDDNSIVDDSRPCKRCGKYPTEEGYDSCLGTLKGVKYACCGHGIPGEAYVVLEDGTRIPELDRDHEKMQREFDEWYANYLKEHGGL